MYELLDPISDESVDALKALMSDVAFRDDDSHGVNVVETSKWLEWSREQRALYKSLLPEAYIEKALVGSFLHVPADTGYLEPQTAWVNASMAGVMYSYALEDDLEIIIGDDTVVVEKGQGVKFSLKEVHEIKTKSTDQNWACLMLMI